MDSRQKSLILCASIAAVGTASFAIYQLTRILFSVVRDAEFEATKLLACVTAQIESDSTDVGIPEELLLEDDIEEIFSYGSLQELYYRRDIGGDTDWLWSFDKDEWYSTGELSPDHTLILDPPSIIFISRLHLTSVARRKSLAADARAAGSKQAARIPPPVELPDWAKQQIQQQQQLQQQKPQQPNNNSQQLQPVSSSDSEQSNGLAVCGVHSSSSSNNDSSNSSRVISGQETSCSGRCSSGGSSSGGAGGRARRLEDAPELLCCPITGQMMLQPVSLPSGKTFEYEAIRRWITQHGTDPTTGLHPVSLLDLHPNLVVREMVEKWLNGVDPLGDHVMDTPAALGGVSEPMAATGLPETEIMSK